MSRDENEILTLPGFGAENALQRKSSTSYEGHVRSWPGGAVELADTWRGTAPFCDGECLPGEEEVERSECGDGSCCWTGTKVLCRNSNPTCIVTQTNTECVGPLMICDNGSYDYRGVWTSCARYLCGICTP
jgi:hypothetical protein